MTAAKNIFLIGSGGLGHEIAHHLKNCPEFIFSGFYDDDPATAEKSGKWYMGKINLLEKTGGKSDSGYLISIGSPFIKKKIADRLKNAGLSYATFISDYAHLADKVSIEIGEGSIITPGCQLTCDIIVGKKVLINLNSTIGHDVKIGDYSSLMPGCHISGNVKIDEEVLVGTGAIILPNLSIGKGAVIGAGAVVTRDVEEGKVVKGIPGRG